MNALKSLANTIGRQNRSALLRIGLALLLLPGIASAGGGPGRGCGIPTPMASSPGEEITGLPFTDTSSGTTLVGELSDLQSLVLFWHSEGTVHFQRLEGGRFAVTFVGNHYLELDREVLARADVHITFRGGNSFTGGTAMLRIGRSDPVQLPSGRVPLPLGRLADVPEIQGAAMSLEVVGPRLQHARIGTSFGRERVTLVQVMR